MMVTLLHMCSHIRNIQPQFAVPLYMTTIHTHLNYRVKSELHLIFSHSETVLPFSGKSWNRKTNFNHLGENFFMEKSYLSWREATFSAVSCWNSWPGLGLEITLWKCLHSWEQNMFFCHVACVTSFPNPSCPTVASFQQLWKSCGCPTLPGQLLVCTETPSVAFVLCSWIFFCCHLHLVFSQIHSRGRFTALT